MRRLDCEEIRVGYELGIQGPAVDLARFTERALDRADYRRLCEPGLTTREALNSAEDRVLLPLLGNDTRKIAAVRDDNGGCSRFVDSCHILSTLYIPLDPCKK